MLNKISTIKNFNIIDKKFSAGEGKVLANGKKIALITYGQTMTSVAYKVNKLLIKKNIEIKIINFPSLNFFLFSYNIDSATRLFMTFASCRVSYSFIVST